MYDEFKTLVSKLIDADKNRIMSFLFTGPPGTSKTFTAIEIAEKFSPGNVFKIDGSPNLTKEDMEGLFISKGKEMIFLYGKLSQAVKAANEKGRATIIVNEFNLFLPAVQASFNALLDFQAELNLATGESIAIDNKCKLLFIATMNENLAGVQQVQDAVRTRFTYCYNFDYPTIKEEMNLYESYFVSSSNNKLFCEFLSEIRKMYIERNLFHVQCTIREAFNFLQARTVISPKEALTLTITNKLARTPEEVQIIERLADGKQVLRESKIELPKVEKTDLPFDNNVVFKNSNEFEVEYAYTGKWELTPLGVKLFLDKEVSIDFNSEFRGCTLTKRNGKIFFKTLDVTTNKLIKIIL